MPSAQSPQSSSSPPSRTDELPTLQTYPTTTPTDRTSALRLIADSIAQQRQLSSYSLITHPYTLSAAILLLGILSQYIELYTFITTTAGLIMTFLVIVRSLTAGYLSLAEGINYNWLEGPGSRFPLLSSSKKSHHRRSSSTSSTSSSGSGSGNVEPAPVTKSSNSGSGGGRRLKSNSNSKAPDTGIENVVVVSKWGEEEIIGALVMKVMKKERKAVLRAWTVKLRYRGREIGRGLLEEGVRLAMAKGCTGVEFDAGHASESLRRPFLSGLSSSWLTLVSFSIDSHRILPQMFNKGFERREKKANGMLAQVMAEQGMGRS
ncbi:MAG: hypothetical protein LQ352_002258 [Teloschistes flavicans]|nr:MAG: hypothetical protein LQ352_002258 [Teloschistes flavicans]